MLTADLTCYDRLFVRPATEFAATERNVDNDLECLLPDQRGTVLTWDIVDDSRTADPEGNGSAAAEREDRAQADEQLASAATAFNESSFSDAASVLALYGDLDCAIGWSRNALEDITIMVITSSGGWFHVTFSDGRILDSSLQRGGWYERALGGQTWNEYKARGYDCNIDVDPYTHRAVITAGNQISTAPPTPSVSDGQVFMMTDGQGLTFAEQPAEFHLREHYAERYYLPPKLVKPLFRRMTWTGWGSSEVMGRGETQVCNVYPPGKPCIKTWIPTSVTLSDPGWCNGRRVYLSLSGGSSLRSPRDASNYGCTYDAETPPTTSAEATASTQAESPVTSSETDAGSEPTFRATTTGYDRVILVIPGSTRVPGSVDATGLGRGPLRGVFATRPTFRTPYDAGGASLLWTTDRSDPDPSKTWAAISPNENQEIASIAYYGRFRTLRGDASGATTLSAFKNHWPNAKVTTAPSLNGVRGGWNVTLAFRYQLDGNVRQGWTVFGFDYDGILRGVTIVDQSYYATTSYCILPVCRTDEPT